jgi:hypothetical protein
MNDKMNGMHCKLVCREAFKLNMSNLRNHDEFHSFSSTTALILTKAENTFVKPPKQKGHCENRTRDLSHPKRESYH